MAQAPVKKIRIGMLSASIWATTTDTGPMYNTTFNRSYKTGNEWKDSSSFGIDALGTIGILATLSAAWIAAQIERDRQQRNNNGGNDGQDQAMAGNGPQIGNANRGGTRGGTGRGNNGVVPGVPESYHYDSPDTTDHPPY